MSRRFYLLIIVVVLGIYQMWNEREVSRPPGVLVSEEPQQKNLPTNEKPILYKDVVIEPLAEYTLQARVLSTSRYWLDPISHISPIDLALGWGVMSDTSILEKLSIKQMGRFYYYSWYGRPPSDPKILGQSSANVHIIPANEYVESEVKKLRVGHLVTLQGFLVRVNRRDGSDWKSSLTRDDQGNGACEVMWVRNLTYRD